MPRPYQFKIFVVSSFYALGSQSICILQIGSFNWGLWISCWFNAVYYGVWIEGYKIIFVRSFSFAKDQQAFEIKPVNIQSRSLKTLVIKRTSAALLLNSVITPNLNIYLHNYLIESAFIATKNEKTIIAVI